MMLCGRYGPRVHIDFFRCLAQMVMSFFDHWNLSSEDQAFLLGLAPGNRDAMGRYREGARIGTTREEYERVGHLLGIHRNPRLLFLRNRDVAYGWMKMCNCASDGMTPVDAIKEYGFAGLLMVRAYLDRVDPVRFVGEVACSLRFVITIVSCPVFPEHRR
ncbi:hypothetical protein A6V37_35975 [Paraburkholderia ginsengiterrae]|uniref:Antitoxin Xre/MbcA/ParS-like toxin-binding domain-containing protein n=2 Tax=Paraburkholderia ginsengiterrae TaxID=1462993 RepID=A0A1A9N010_9BURK|nr:hypothetical protein A6V37_35975 [Paraburkholderia ginsengiterrae]